MFLSHKLSIALNSLIERKHLVTQKADIGNTVVIINLGVILPAFWFSLNDSETVKAVTLAFGSIQ